MKRYLIFTAVFFLIGGIFSAYAQDMIILKNGDEIKARVIEISPTEIKYKRFDNLNGPTVIIRSSTVLMIQYENGTREIINAGTSAQGSSSTASTSYDPDDPQAKQAVEKKWLAFGLNIIGLGIGSFVQGDTTGGTIGVLGDLLSFGMIIAGSLNPIIETETRTYGTYPNQQTIEVPSAPKVNPIVYVGYVAYAGVKIFQLVRPFSYANKFSVAFLPAFDNDGQLALAAYVSLKY